MKRRGQFNLKNGYFCRFRRINRCKTKTITIKNKSDMNTKSMCRTIAMAVLFLAGFNGNTLKAENAKPNGYDGYALSDSPQSNAMSRKPSDFSYFGLSYSSGFTEGAQGIYGVYSNVFGDRTRIGFTFGIGSNFNTPVAVQFQGGLNYFIPVTDAVFIFAPLCFVWSQVTIGKEDYKSWGFQLTPTLGVKMGFISAGAGFALGWSKGADKLGTGFTLSLGFDIF